MKLALEGTNSSWSERSEEHTSELQSPCNLVCRLLLEKKKIQFKTQSRKLSPQSSNLSTTLLYGFNIQFPSPSIRVESFSNASLSLSNALQQETIVLDP